MVAKSNTGRLNRKSPSLFLPDFPLLEFRGDVFYEFNYLVTGQEITLTEQYVAFLAISIIMAQIRIAAMTFNKLNIKEVIPLPSCNTYIKFIASSPIGKSFCNILSSIEFFSLISTEEAEDPENVLLPELESGPSTTKMDIRLMAMSKDNRNSGIRGHSRKYAGLLTSTPFYHHERYAKGTDLKVDQIDSSLLFDNLDAKLKGSVDKNNVINFLVRSFNGKEYVDGVNVKEKPKDSSDNLVLLERTLGLNINREIYPTEIPFQPSNLDPDAKNISRVEKLRRQSVQSLVPRMEQKGKGIKKKGGK